MSLLVIISGHPASGKTTLAHRLAKDLGDWPIVSRDTLKETLFDSLGWQDRAWSQKLGQASWELWPWAIELILKTGHPVIAESNFTGPKAGALLLQLTATYGYRSMEIHCVAPREILARRFTDRITAGARHPGHQDEQNLEEFMQRFQEPGVLSGVSRTPIILSTEGLSDETYQDLVEQCKMASQ